MSSKLLMVGLLASSMMAMPALAATTISGSVGSIDARSVDPGLVITANGLSFGSFTLDASSPATASTTAPVFQIGSSEDVVNWWTINWPFVLGEDTTPYNIAVTLDFSAPEGVSGSPLTGETFGVLQLLGNGYGHVSWGDPQTFTFGDGGAFTVALQDTDFKIGGAATNVIGTFTLLSDATPAVPEPATWAMMIGGFGLIGAAMRRRRKISVTYA